MNYLLFGLSSYSVCFQGGKALKMSFVTNVFTKCAQLGAVDKCVLMQVQAIQSTLRIMVLHFGFFTDSCWCKPFGAFPPGKSSPEPWKPTRCCRLLRSLRIRYSKLSNLSTKNPYFWCHKVSPSFWHCQISSLWQCQKVCDTFCDTRNMDPYLQLINYGLKFSSA